jgi:hypothetical protein
MSVPCSNLLADSEVPRGTLVEIPAGVEWRSTHPTKDRGVTKRTLRVRVPCATRAFDGRLTWAGGGGFWKWVKKTEARICTANTPRSGAERPAGANVRQIYKEKLKMDDDDQMKCP